MSSLLFQTIDQLSREKNIEQAVIISAVEDAMLVAARKYYKSAEDLRATLNRETGVIEIFAVKKVVEDVANSAREISLAEAQKLAPDATLESEVRLQKPTDVLGRIAAQTAKQVIFQKVREAERENVYSEYIGKVGEMINCVVKRLEGSDVIVDMGKTEGRMPRREQSRLETFQIGERVRAIIVQVDKSSRGPQVIISRADPSLVSRLFEMEVPEIYDGTVVIRSAAREPGERTKIAVMSKDRDVDCVGACVGMKGMRVQSIIRELHGEKIDIIEYNEDPSLFAANALSPAKINRVVLLDSAAKHLEVIADDNQLSLAIGKKGQNVRLASKLIGWRIDIKSEEEKRQEVESQMDSLVSTSTPLSAVEGIGEKTIEKLVEREITTVEKLGEMTPEQLEEIPGIGPKMVEKIRQAVNNYYAQFEEAAASPDDVVEADKVAAEAVADTSAVPTEEAAAEPTVEATLEVAGEMRETGETDEPGKPDQETDSANDVEKDSN
ncbi:MAG: transcription termination/antitermination protein NusA [Acidobacteria bacterium]|nr:transcription termination/antitermination protein NusA [Acidobacteriota bacterium]